MPANFGRRPFQTTGYDISVSADGAPERKIGGITLAGLSKMPTNSTGSPLVLLDQTTVQNGFHYLLFGTTMCRITTLAGYTVAVTGNPTGGTFTISVTDTLGTIQTTTAIAYNASASTVQTAVQALSNVGSGNATVTGTTNATGTAEVDTMTPGGTITAADNFVIPIPGGGPVNFVAVSGSVTPTNIVTGLKASWAANPVAAALATATGTATLILTAVTKGVALNLGAPYVEGVGTLTNSIATAVAATPLTITFPAALGAVTVAASGASLTGGTTPAATPTVIDAASDAGMFGPFDASATDGRATLTQGDCFVLEKTWLDTPVPAFPNQGTSHPPVIYGGRVDLPKLVLSTGQGTNSLPSGYPAGPTRAAFQAAFPRIALVTD